MEAHCECCLDRFAALDIMLSHKRFLQETHHEMTKFPAQPKNMRSDYRRRLIGRKFGKLTVVAFSHLAKLNKTVWLCRCDCGGEKKVRSDCLQKGATQSCGCLANPIGPSNKQWRGFGRISQSLWYKYMVDAKKRGIPFTITIEYAWELFTKQNGKCALTGESLTFGHSKVDANRNASLDRIHPAKGYSEGNVQWVTKRVNFAKQGLEQEAFIQLCRQVARYSDSSCRNFASQPQLVL